MKINITKTFFSISLFGFMICSGSISELHSQKQNRISDAASACAAPRFSTPVIISYSFSDSSYDTCAQKRSLSHLIFNKDFTMQDVYLFSKLSSSGKVSVDMATGSSGLTRGSTTLVAKGFGSFADDFFTTLCASTYVAVVAEQRALVADAGLVYRAPIERWNNLYSVWGLSVPFKSFFNVLDFQLVGGQLRSSATDVGLDKMLRDFFGEFTSIEDFFVSGVLAPKGLTWKKLQRKVGVGDVTLFSMLDFGNFGRYIHGVQVGINCVFPVAGKKNSDTIWDTVLGNGGAFQVEFFGQALFESGYTCLNPSIRLVGQLSAPFSWTRRVPKIKQQQEVRITLTNQVQKEVGLIVPNAFDDGSYFIDAFQEYDATVFELADQAVKTRTRYGSRVVLDVTNYMYNVCNLGFRLGVTYQFMYKGTDSVCVSHKQCSGVSRVFNTALLESSTQERSHMLGFDCAYQFQKAVELHIGSHHHVAGKNIARTHGVFVLFAAVF